MIGSVTVRWMVMRSGLFVVQAVLCRHCHVTLLNGDDSACARSFSRAQHGSGHRAPDGEQQRQQDQDDDAQILHAGGLSVHSSVLAVQRKFPVQGATTQPETRCAPRVARRWVADAIDDKVSAPARPSRMGHSGRSSP